MGGASEGSRDAATEGPRVAATVPADAPARNFLRVSGPRVRDVDGLDV
jgi:hypothetical protein